MNGSCNDMYVRCIVCEMDNCHFASVRTFNDETKRGAFTISIHYVCEGGHSFSQTQYFFKGIIYESIREENIKDYSQEELGRIMVNGAIVLERSF